MIGISEAVCTDVQGALLVEKNEGVGKSGGAGTENLFAALLAALSGGLPVPQNELDVVVQEVAQDAQIDVAVDGAGAAGTTAPLPEGCGDEAGMPSAEAAPTDVAPALAGDEMSADIADTPAVSDEIPADVASIAASDEMAADIANSAAASDEALTDVANAAAASDKTLADITNADNTTGTADDQATVVSAHRADRSAELESPADPDANSPPKLPTRVEYSAQADKASYAAAEGNKAAARGSPAGAKLPAPGERPAEPETGAQPVLSSEADEVPSSPGSPRVAAHSWGDDNVPMGPRHDAQPGGNDLARGSGEKLFLESLVHSHGPGAQRAVNATENAMWRVSDVGRADLTEPVIEQTVRGVLLSVRDGASELRVRIQPEHLGELHLRMVFKDNVLSLDVNAQSTVVKSIIESNLGRLRQSLHSNGVDVGKVSVTVDPDVSSGGHFSREAPVFQPSEGEWAGTYRGDREEQKPPLEQWFRGARMRHAVNHLDLVA